MCVQWKDSVRDAASSATPLTPSVLHARASKSHQPTCEGGAGEGQGEGQRVWPRVHTMRYVGSMRACVGSIRASTHLQLLL